MKMIIKRAEVLRRDTCQEPTELRCMGCLTESMWTPKSKIKFVDTNNQLADMLTEGNFTCDEWGHLLRLLNVINFSVFSCSHFLSTQEAEHHVEESSGTKDRRRACGGEIKASEFDCKKFDRESISQVGFGCVILPRELQIRLEFCSHQHWQFGARQSRKLSVMFSSVAQRWQSVFKNWENRYERWISVQALGNLCAE